VRAGAEGFGGGRGREGGASGRRPGTHEVRLLRRDQERSADARRRDDRRLGRTRPQVGRELHDRPRAARRRARRRDGRVARRGRRGLRPERPPGRTDRQGRRAAALRRRRHLGRDPAPRRHEGLEGDRRDQQGRRRPDLQRLGLRPGRRPLQGRAGDDGRGEEAEGALSALAPRDLVSRVRSWGAAVPPRPFSFSAGVRRTRSGLLTYHRYSDTDGISMAMRRLPVRRTRSEAKEDTRARLLAAARRVFVREGFHGATVDMVAAEAGFTKGAVYSAFTSKADLFLAVYE